MAGSFNHCIMNSDEEEGPIDLRLREEPLLECGDWYEAVEELYGMIFYLANGDVSKVLKARDNYEKGIELSPGINAESFDEEE